MFIMNDLMKNRIDNYEINNFELIEKIVSKTKVVKDYILFDENDKINESTFLENFKLKKLLKNSSQYEYGNNEIRIDNIELFEEQLFNFLIQLNLRFMRKFNRRMVFYIIILEESNCIELHFHTYRQEEVFFYRQDPNLFKSPILYYISD